jgi:hypothetical protein
VPDSAEAAAAVAGKLEVEFAREACRVGTDQQQAVAVGLPPAVLLAWIVPLVQPIDAPTVCTVGSVSCCCCLQLVGLYLCCCSTLELRSLL